MKPATILKLDRYAGLPLCFALTVFDRIRKLFSTVPVGRQTPRRILFLKLTEQGASVLACAAVKRAADMAGRKNVYFCVFRENRPILDIMGVIDHANVFEIRQDNLMAFCRDMFRFFILARKHGIDTVIDMEFFSRASAIISYLSGCVIRVGCHKYTSDLPWRGDLMTHKIQYNPYIHVSQQYDLLVKAAARPADECPMLKVGYEDRLPAAPSVRPEHHIFDHMKATLQRLGVGDGRPIVLLNPNASDMLPIRKWETERFIELAGRLIERHAGLIILFTGAPSERSRCEEIAARVGSARALSLAGHTTLEELIALYWMADILVTNDSGPGHFASLTGIKAVVMFGPETPLLYGPLGGGARFIWKRLACSPCVSAFNHRNTPCKDNVCMQAITVDEVLETVEKLMG